MSLNAKRLANIKSLLMPYLPESKVVEGLFSQQKALFSDESKRKAALCTRRAGKSHTAAGLLLASLLKNNTNNLYLTLTNKSAKSIMWPKLTEVARMAHAQIELKESMQQINCRNSTLRLLGADLSNIADRLRGVYYDLVVIDEAQSFGNNNLIQLIDDVLEPALLDKDGTLVLIGTPGLVPYGRFFDLTTKESNFSVHRWGVVDNPHIPHAEKWISDLLQSRGWTRENPSFRREFLGEWVIDPNKQIYRYHEAKNSYFNLPREVGASAWHYVIGLDLGWRDSTAISVVAFSYDHHSAYIVDTWSASLMTPSAIGQKLKEFVNIYNPIKIVADTGGLGRAIVEDYKARLHLNIEAAEKTDKFATIEMMNGDFIDQRLFVEQGQTELVKQYAMLTWTEDYKEDPTVKNDLCDATLYAYRASRHYWGAIKPKKSLIEQQEQDILDHAITLSRRQSDDWSEDFN